MSASCRRQWLVWSCSKRCWWGPDSCGYTNDVREAGRYSDAEALRVVERMNYAPSSGAAGTSGAGDHVQLVPANKRWLELERDEQLEADAAARRAS